MSWSEAPDASTNYTASASASASASFSTQASASDTYALANVNGYVDVDYVVDFYVDDNAWTTGGSAGNTWSAA